MKKLIALLLTIALAVSLCAVFVGCRNNLDDFEIPEGGYDGSKVTIKFYHIMGQEYRKYVDLYTAEFNKLYPNITVIHEAKGKYDDVRNQIKTELTGKDYPTMAYCYPDHVALYNQSKKVVPLDSLIDSNIEITRADGSKERLGFTPEQKADFYETFWNEGKQFADGKMYTLPFAKSTEVLFYNTKVFTELGLEVPTHWFPTDNKKGLQTEDHTSMEYVCAYLKNHFGDACTPLGYDSEANWFITLMQQAGLPYTSAKGDNYLFNTEGARNLMARLREWYQAGYFTTGSLYTNGDSGYTSQLFTGQNLQLQSYMCIGSSAGAGNQCPPQDENTQQYPFEVGIATIPQMSEDDDITAISQGPNVCLFNRANPQEVVASWLFLKFLLTNLNFQYEFTKIGGYVPPIKSLSNPDLAATVPAVKKYLQNMENANGNGNISYLSQQVCLGMNQGRTYDQFFTSPAFPGSSTARDQVGRLLVACISNKGEAESVIKKAFSAAINECQFGG